MTFEDDRDAAALNSTREFYPHSRELNHGDSNYFHGFISGTSWSREYFAKEIDALKAKHEELLSYLPKVPTEPSDKAMAKEIDRPKKALELAIRFLRVDCMHGHITKEFAANTLAAIDNIMNGTEK